MFIAICDDDANESAELKIKCRQALNLINPTSPIVIHIYRYGHDFISLIKANAQIRYDIIVMDIEFGENAINGIETIRQLREMRITAPVIISTSYDDYLRQGYGLGIIRYLSKPVTQDAVNEAFAACFKHIGRLEGKEIILRSGSDNVVIKYTEIMYFENYGHYIVAHTKDKKEYTFRSKFECLEKQIPQTCFMKIHKSILVNLNYVSYIKGHDLVIDDGTILPVAQRRRGPCMEFLRQYIKENM